MSESSIFTKIINGDIPAEFIYKDDICVCIKDVSPQAPTHVLIIPRKPIARVVDASGEEDKAILGHLMLKAGEVARQLGVEDAFRLVVNNGEDAGQTVFHLHIHLMANKKFAEGGMAF